MFEFPVNKISVFFVCKIVTCIGNDKCMLGLLDYRDYLGVQLPGLQPLMTYLDYFPWITSGLGANIALPEILILNDTRV